MQKVSKFLRNGKSKQTIKNENKLDSWQCCISNEHWANHVNGKIVDKWYN